MQVIGVIDRIELHSVPAKVAEVGKLVARIALKIDRAEDERGQRIDVANLSGLQFQGPPQLVDRFAPGERVKIVTTTASGMHIETIVAAPLS
jgi:hypothetical protein